MDEASINKLTQRQRACLRLVGRGLTSKTIALELTLGHRTVDAHIENARRTLGASTRAEAAAFLAAVERASAELPKQPQSLDLAADSPAFPISSARPEPEGNGVAEVLATYVADPPQFSAEGFLEDSKEGETQQPTAPVNLPAIIGSAFRIIAIVSVLVVAMEGISKLGWAIKTSFFD